MSSLAMLETMMKSKKKFKHSKLTITENNTKVLGHITDQRKDKVAESNKFNTHKMKTHNSAWTPVTNKASNEQIFLERRDLVSHWFDLWTDSQRKRFLNVIFHQCGRRQLTFVQDWFQEAVPLQHLDFTTVLPRFLSLYVMSFLEPKTLSRASQVCWHWKFLSDQDVLWSYKCLKYGWFLPYCPADNEYGAWKRHYIACVQTLDYVTFNNNMYGTRNDGSSLMQRKPQKKGSHLTTRDRNTLMTSRPPWNGPDYKPKDLDHNLYAFLHDFNPNEPNMPKSALLFHNRWGILKKDHNVTITPDKELGLTTVRRRDRHRALTSGEDYDLMRTGRSATLTETLRADLQNLKETHMEELVNTEWYPSVRTSARRPDLSGGGNYAQNIKTSTGVNCLGPAIASSNPRVVFISSRVPAAELLLDAVLFGVIPIVYEYEGMTAESLSLKMESALDGRQAQSVGLFCHTEETGEIRLVHGCTVTLESLDMPDLREFFETLSSHILPASEGGQFDVFSPLAASERGMELLVQLSAMTGVQFSSPTGIIGSYNHVTTEWLIPYKNCSPQDIYFCASKLHVWTNTADQAAEALNSCKHHLAPFFEKTHQDIAAQLAGEIVFGVVGQTDIRGVKDITTLMVEGFKSLGQQDNVNPLEFLGEYLLREAGVSDLRFTGTQKQVGTQQYEQPHEPELEGKEWEEEEEEEGIMAQDNRRIETEEEADREAKKDEGTEKAQREKEVKQRKTEEKRKLGGKTSQLSQKFGTLRATGRLEKLTSQVYTDHPEKRSPIAMEILSSEVEFNRLVQAVKTIFFKPLNAALKSNRAIVSFQNLQIIFSDILAILDLSNELLENLRNRLMEWDAQETCLGDIFVKFCTHLKVYTNFVNNNEVILRCIERSKEQTPSFRAFLKRNDRIAETKMMTLQELLLLPSRRINEYVMLLSWFEMHTPKSHQDRADLMDALQTLTELNRCIKECQLRMLRDREIIELQRTIQNCPALLEANRYLLKHQDVCHWNPPMDSEIPELRVYQHVAMFGLFLFNDALVITRRFSKHFPFSRAVEYTYKYGCSLSLKRMRIHDISDSKIIRNAFKIETPRQEWYCTTDNKEEKFNWISLLEQTIRATMQG